MNSQPSIIDACKDVLFQIAELDRAFNDIEDKRRRSLQLLAAQTSASVVYWATGQGHPMLGGVPPVRSLVHGLEPDQQQRFFEYAYSDAANEWIRKPFVPRLEQRPQVCLSRSLLYDDATWHQCEAHRLGVEHASVDNWMIAVRYQSNDSWSNLGLFRPPRQPDFSDTDRSIVDLVLSAASWFHVPLREDLPPKTRDLSPRQGQVLVLLLEGNSRKQIAAKLQLTTHIVNDCMKAIFQHYNVSSATELAAQFLRRA
jgi:DNA-binding CsgD family transcriptional regulator